MFKHIVVLLAWVFSAAVHAGVDEEMQGVASTALLTQMHQKSLNLGDIISALVDLNEGAQKEFMTNLSRAYLDQKQRCTDDFFAGTQLPVEKTQPSIAVLPGFSFEMWKTFVSETNNKKKNKIGELRGEELYAYGIREVRTISYGCCCALEQQIDYPEVRETYPFVDMAAYTCAPVESSKKIDHVLQAIKHIDRIAQHCEEDLTQAVRQLTALKDMVADLQYPRKKYSEMSSCPGFLKNTEDGALLIYPLKYKLMAMACFMLSAAACVSGGGLCAGGVVLFNAGKIALSQLSLCGCVICCGGSCAPFMGGGSYLDNGCLSDTTHGD